MSVGMLASETATAVATSRPDRKTAKSGGDSDTGFKNLVKDRPDSKSDGARTTQSESTDAPLDAGHGVWRRYDVLLDTAGHAEGAEDVAGAESANPADDELEGPATGDGLAAGVEAVAAIGANPAAAEQTQSKGGGQAVPSVPGRDMPADAPAAAPPGVSVETAKAASPVLAAQMASVAREGHQIPNQSQTARQMPGEPASTNAPSATQRVEVEEIAANRQAGAHSDERSGDRSGREQPSQGQAAQPGGNRVAGVSVISQQAAPAPAVIAQPVATGATGTAFAASLAAGILPGERAEAAINASLAQSAGKAGALTSLRIQLHPVELGMVTARLSGADAGMSIEITVENAEARHRLSSDSEAIISALRNVGIEVDRITIQQSQANTGSGATGSGRGGEFAQSGDSRGERQGQASQQQPETGRERGSRGGNDNAKTDPGGGVYI